MNYRDLYQQFSENLNSVYDAREASVIARYLIEDLTGQNFWSESDVSAVDLAKVEEATQRLLKFEPWQYIGGIADFYGMRFSVNPSVLIPRPETEELVYLALDVHHKMRLKNLLDVGTGSGIIAVTLAKKGNWDHVTALDISLAALDTAKQNAEAHQVNVQFMHTDFMNESQWSHLPSVQLVISNPPYIHPDEAASMDANVLSYEPAQALFVQHDVMEFYHSLARFVMKCQPPGCRLMVEIHEKYGRQVQDVFAYYGLTQIFLFQDLQGKDRFVVGVKG
ncbi:MAG: peptide chain release factor N(5)-glutamine methyltransferase [Saprospiraceae bacterium]|jgi:release factor glutamine methyltransferase|nr:peptide chain release factor N(5)-glutamine methyltransferase [Saprospiraceae bacterium]